MTARELFAMKDKNPVLSRMLPTCNMYGAYMSLDSATRKAPIHYIERSHLSEGKSALLRGPMRLSKAIFSPIMGGGGAFRNKRSKPKDKGGAKFFATLTGKLSQKSFGSEGKTTLTVPEAFKKPSGANIMRSASALGDLSRLGDGRYAERWKEDNFSLPAHNTSSSTVILRGTNQNNVSSDSRESLDVVGTLV